MSAPHDTPSTGRQFSRRSTYIGGALALLILIGVGWLAWRLTHPAAATGPGGQNGRRGMPVSTVGVATAMRADMPVFLDALGTITTSATATVRPQVSGVLQKVLFAEGQTVKAGQTLAVIDPRPFELALMQAGGQRQRDEAQLENAQLTLKRYRSLLEQDSIARQDVDTQAALVKQLEGTVTTDRAAEGTAKLNLGYSSITAPIGGRIGLRTVDVGNVVSSGDAGGIAVITQVAPIDVVFAVPQDRVPELRARIADKADLPVTVLDRNRIDVLDQGSFLALDNQVDTATGTVRAKARFANESGKLFPSQFVNVRLLVRTIKDAVVVPVTALRHSSKGDYVYVLHAADKTVSLRPVQPGQATVDKVAIAVGLQAGEQVVTEGADRLKDGSRVMLPGDKPNFGGKGGGKGKRDASASASASATASTTATKIAGPTPEQRQRMLDKVKDDPDALAKRKAFLDQIDQGDPAALERWQRMQERLRQGGQGAAQ